MKTRGWKVGTLLVAVAFLALAVTPSMAAAQSKVLIGFTQMPGKAEEALVRGVGGKIKYTYHNVPAIAATLPEQAVKGLMNNPRVTYIEPDVKMWAIDAELDSSWGVQHIGAGAVHADPGGTKGLGVRVAIIDTGIDYTHDDLKQNYAGGFDFVNGFYDPLFGWYENDDDGPMDDNGHGTHVAGIVAAEDDGSGVVGVAPEAHLYAYKALDQDGSGYLSDVVAAISLATHDPANSGHSEFGADAHVINMSLGGPHTLTLEIACAMAYLEGRTLVAAAGNEGNPPGKGDNISYPAGYDSVIAVAATNQNDGRAWWSSTGAATELSAPGVEVLSTYLGGGYAWGSGTSMASPHVAGTAALVIAAKGLNNEAVRVELQATADDLGKTGWDPKYGHGLVDADEAVLGEAPPPPPPPPPGGIMYVDSITFSSKVAGRNIFFYTTVKVVDGADLPLEGVGVELTLNRDEGGGPWNFSGNTDSDGTVKFTLMKAQAGEYTATVTNITLGETEARCVLEDDGTVTPLPFP